MKRVALDHGRKLSSVVIADCEHCGKKFEFNSGKPHRFCSVRCSNVHDFELGKRGMTTYDGFLKRWTEKFSEKRKDSHSH